jgi:L-iditol 2-dehydrogenase
MKAVVLKKPHTLVYQEIPTPKPGPGQVLLQVKAASICGSDMLRVYHGAAKVLPLVLGHECAGLVAAVGAGVSPNLVGRAAALAPLVPCMACPNCRRGQYSACPHYSFIGSRVNGGFAEYLAAPAANMVWLPEGVTFDHGALVEPLSVARHALDRGGGAQGKQVVVVGVGSIGLLTVQMAAVCGAAQVIALDVVDANLRAAEFMGTAAGINARRVDAAEEVLILTGGGADMTLEISGAPAGLALAVAVTRPGGHVVFVGNQPENDALPMALVEQVMRRELNLHGAWMSYSAPFPGHEWSETLHAIAAGRLRLADMITHHTTLANLPAMFARLHAGMEPHRKILIQMD